MKYSYEGVGEVCATFACGSGATLREDMPVKMSGSGTVSPCGEGEAFCGIVRAVGHDGKACSVALHGSAVLGYSGTAPGVGPASLLANASGGVAGGANGTACLVVAVDTTAKTVTIIY